MNIRQILNLLESAEDPTPSPYTQDFIVKNLDQFVDSEEEDGEEVQEAKLGGVSSKELDEPTMTQYLSRILNKEKTKKDKYRLPYIHRSHIVPIVDETGEKYDLDILRQKFTVRPKRILKQNEKMQHSDGSISAYYNIGLPALRGLAVDESTGKFVVIDTCPGAGECQTFCFAMKGGYVQWPSASLSTTRLLNFLYNDPEGFMNKLYEEISNLERRYERKNVKLVVRWHDAGDFFSPQYLKMGFDLANRLPSVDFYAYTKIADVAQTERPPNFKINFSMGAQRSQEKRIDFKRTKHSKVVPNSVFQDLIAMDDGKIVKDENGRTMFKSEKDIKTLIKRIAEKYAIDPSTIISYDQMMKMPVGDEQKWNVIVRQGDGDDAANRRDVLGSYLLQH